MSNLGIGSDLADEAAPKGAIERWLLEHPEEAKEFWDYVGGVLKNNYPIYPVMKKLVASIGGPPGDPSAVRRFISEQLSKLPS